MSEEELEARLQAVERALTDDDVGVAELSDAAAVHRRLDDVEARLDTLTERVDALDATVQSLHGYVGELEHVNDRVERRADAARAAVERLDGGQHSHARQPTARQTTADSESRNHSGTDTQPSDEPPEPSPEESLLDRVRDSL